MHIQEQTMATDIKPKRHNRTLFKHDFGYHVLDIADIEETTPEAIYMRVKNYGNPWQRRKSPTTIERHYCKTARELAIELGMHPLTCQVKHNEFGSAYHKKPLTDHLKGWTCTDHAWKTSPKWKCSTWLAPQHPDYDAWRRGELFPEDFIQKPLDY